MRAKVGPAATVPRTAALRLVDKTEAEMRYLVAAALIAGAVGWAIFGDQPLQQVASATEAPRQLSQISR